jgi:hypothetical protein
MSTQTGSTLARDSEQQPAASTSSDGEVVLAIGGMTCGACVARVARALNDL